jgi:hypothetical protein
VADAAEGGLTLVDESGDPLQMGTLDAAATLLTGDPYLTSGGITYYFLPAGGDCSTSPDPDNCFVSADDTPIQDAIDFAAINQPDPILWTEPYTGDTKVVHPIYVEGGHTYNEQLTISDLANLTNLGLIGVSGGTPTVGDLYLAGAGPDAPVLQGDNADGTGIHADWFRGPVLRYGHPPERDLGQQHH